MNLDTLIEAKRVGEEVIPVVDLRGLHKLLEVKRKFADWAKDRVKYYKEGEHYVVLSFSTPSLDKNGKKRASTSKEYYVSLEIANTTGKMHKNVIRDIEEEKAKLGSILADMGDRLKSEPISENLEKLEAIQEMLNGFKEDSYVDSNGRRQKAYNLTEGAATQILLRYSPEARAYFIYQFKKMHQTIINMFKVKVVEQVLPEIKGEQKYLYIIRNEDSGNIKLGISSDPHARLKQLQTGNDSELRLVYSSYVCTNAREIEIAMHEYFQDSHIRGEWFSVSVEEAIRYMNNVVYHLNSKMPSLEHI